MFFHLLSRFFKRGSCIYIDDYFTDIRANPIMVLPKLFQSSRRTAISASSNIWKLAGGEGLISLCRKAPIIDPEYKKVPWINSKFGLVEIQ